MALPTNITTQYDTIGDREDLSDVIYDISPTETPFMNGIARDGKATAVFTEWQTDSLAAAATNQKLEGDDPTAEALSPTVRVGNYCQISEKMVVTSETVRVINQAGRGDELEYQVAKKGKELKRDMELALVQNQASVAGTEAVARSSAGAESWITTNADHGVGGSTAGYSGGLVAAPVDGTQRALTKTLVDTVMQNCWVAGGSPTKIMVGPHNRTVVSTFSGISTLETRADQGMDVTLVGAVDFYKSNFGTLMVVPNRFQRDRTALILDMDYWAMAYLRAMKLVPLAKTGDSEKRQLITEFTLISKNQGASGKVADLLTS